MANVIVAGGGVSGLAAALSLSHRGHHVVVLEARSAFTELGAGIQLGPNAFQALDRLGVGEQVRARPVYIDELRLMDGTSDRTIVAMPLTEAYRQRFGNPYAVVHRVDLYAPLLDACRAEARIDLCTDAAVQRYEQTPEEVTVQLVDGRQVHGDALIGADGLNSVVRRQLVGDGRPRVSGHTIYRAVVPMERVPGALRSNSVTLWAGPRWHFVHYPISEGRFLNLAATRDDGAIQAVSGQAMEKAHVLGQFPGLGPVPRQLLNLGDNWRCWVLSDRDPVPNWTRGRVVLIGDAAHPMLQYAAQGACQALEDAVFIGDLIEPEETGFVSPFRRFNAERRERTRATQLLARRMGRQLYHSTGRLAAARNAKLSEQTPDQLFDMVQWLHGSRENAPLGAGSLS